jgi:hypothetical protein
MRVRYDRPFFIGVLVARRILLCGLMVGAFVLTLAFSSRQAGLWPSDEAPVTPAAPQLKEARLATTDAVVSHPFSSSSEAMARPTAAVTPPAATMNIPPASAPPEPVQSEPTPAVDNGEMPPRRERGAEHGSRSH